MPATRNMTHVLQDFHGDHEDAAPLPARSEHVHALASGQDPAVICCRSCRYENRLSQSFFVLGIQHLYCRRCGRMIDRHGQPASGS